jgi:hypothetical protein
MIRKRRSRVRSQLILVAVFLIASPGLTKAAVLGHAETPVAPLSGHGFVGQLIHWLESVRHGNFLPSKDQGATVDPNGSPKPRAALSCDQGPTVDPNGCPKPKNAVYAAAGSGSKHH